MPSNEELDALYQTARAVVTNPEFQNVLAEIQSLPASELSQAASTQLTRDALAAKGIQIPEGCTVTLYVLQDLNIPNTLFNMAVKQPVVDPKKVTVCFGMLGQKLCFPSFIRPH